MPALSPTMEQGNIISWGVKEGDEVAPGTVLAEIETDKATLAFENQVGGAGPDCHTSARTWFLQLWAPGPPDTDPYQPKGFFQLPAGPLVTVV